MTKNNEGNNYDGNHGRKFGKLKNIANIGDIVTVEGYELGVFQVESWTHQVDHQSEFIDEVIMYDVTDLKTYNFLIAFQEDISVICKADKADEYLRNLGINKPDSPRTYGEEYSFMIDPVWEQIENMTFLKKEAEEMASSTRGSGKPKEMSKQERINRFLDEINDYEELIRNFGDEAESGDDEYGERKAGEYRERIESAKRKLKRISEGGR